MKVGDKIEFKNGTKWWPGVVTSVNRVGRPTSIEARVSSEVFGDNTHYVGLGSAAAFREYCREAA